MVGDVGKGPFQAGIHHPEGEDFFIAAEAAPDLQEAAGVGLHRAGAAVGLGHFAHFRRQGLPVQVQLIIILGYVFNGDGVTHGQSRGTGL